MADVKHTLALGFDGKIAKKKVSLPAGEARPWDADSELTVVGTEVPRIDGHLKVSGQAKYTLDVSLPGML